MVAKRLPIALSQASILSTTSCATSCIAIALFSSSPIRSPGTGHGVGSGNSILVDALGRGVHLNDFIRVTRTEALLNT